MSSQRTNNTTYFLDLALRCARQGTCLRRNYGAVLANTDGHIIATGYTGAPRGMGHCMSCWRKDNQIPSGSNYEKCMSVHAEMNACLQAGARAEFSAMYLAGYDVETGLELNPRPCFLCCKVLVNSKVRSIVTRESADFPEKLLLEHKLELMRAI